MVFGKFLTFSSILLLLFMPGICLAYDDHTVHPALTKIILDQNRHGLDSDEINVVIEGSIEEDLDPRYLQHFYDPVHNRGLKRGLTSYASSKQWAQVESPANEFTWERGIYEYTWGDKLKGLNILGHVLHLIEDASVPDHTRDDPHPPVLDLGSPYEAWTKQFDLSTFKVIGGTVPERKFSSLDDAFDSMARYSNNNFFSKDTIAVSKFVHPLIYAEKNFETSSGQHVFAIAKDGRILAYADIDSVSLEKTYSLVDPNDLILSDYWRLLSREAVAHGVGVVNLFFKEVEKEKESKVLYRKFAPLPPLWDRIKKDFGMFLGLTPFPSDSLSASLITAVGADAAEVPEESVPPPKNTVRPFSRSVPKLVTPVSIVASPLPVIAPVDPVVPSALVEVGPPSLAPPHVSPPSVVVPGFGGGSPSQPSSPQVAPMESSEPPPAPVVSEPEAPLALVPPNLVINEVAWAGTGGSTTSQWIEIRNMGTATSTLSNVLLSVEGVFDIPLAGEIATGGFYLIESPSDDVVADIPADLIASFGAGLSPVGNRLTLSFLLGTTSSILDETFVCNLWCGRGNLTEASMERISGNSPGNLDSSWKTNNNQLARNGHTAAGQAIPGTPRAQNSASYSLVPSLVSGGEVRLTKALSPYLSSGQNLEVGDGGKLSAEPGVVVKMRGSGINVSRSGSVDIVGSADDPVIFTTLSDSEYGGAQFDDTSPLPGDWAGIRILNTTERSAFENVLIRYAGVKVERVPSFGFLKSIVEKVSGNGLTILDTPSLVSDSSFKNASAAGLHVVGPATSEIIRNQFDRNRIGFSGELMAGILSENQFADNSSKAARIESPLTLSIRENSASLSAPQIISIQTTMASNAALAEFGANTNLPYLIEDGVSIPSGGSVRILPGALFQIKTNPLEVFGQLEARGESSRPIEFTSEGLSSRGGGLLLHASSTSILENVHFSSMSLALNYAPFASIDFSGVHIANSTQGILTNPPENLVRAENISVSNVAVPVSSLVIPFP